VVVLIARMLGHVRWIFGGAEVRPTTPDDDGVWAAPSWAALSWAALSWAALSWAALSWAALSWAPIAA